MRRLVMERLCLMLGSALVLAAVCLYVYDRLEDARAGTQAASAVSQLRQSQSIAAVSEAEQPADSAESLPTEDAESEPEPVSETPASSAEREYLGVLTIPALGLELPVQTEWSKANLKVSPCRQCGSTAGGDLVIAAHNYKSHFGRLSSLSEGDEVRFTSQDGAEAVYTVERTAQVSPEEPEALREGGCPLVLYTCTPGGNPRVGVYCQRENAAGKNRSGKPAAFRSCFWSLFNLHRNRSSRERGKTLRRS